MVSRGLLCDSRDVKNSLNSREVSCKAVEWTCARQEHGTRSLMYLYKVRRTYGGADGGQLITTSWTTPPDVALLEGRTVEMEEKKCSTKLDM